MSRRRARRWPPEAEENIWPIEVVCSRDGHDKTRVARFVLDGDQLVAWPGGSRPPRVWETRLPQGARSKTAKWRLRCDTCGLDVPASRAKLTRVAVELRTVGASVVELRTIASMLS